MDKKEALESALDCLKDIKGGAVPPELAIEEAEALLDYIYELKMKVNGISEKQIIEKINNLLFERCNIKEQQNVEYIFDLQDVNLIQMLLNLYKKKSRMVEIMAEHLTTDTHRKEWVIKYFEDEVKLEDEEE